MNEVEHAGEWVQLVSWHIIKDHWDDAYEVGPIVRTLCGLERMWDGTSLVAFPPDEKTCETCLRIEAKELMK